MTDVEDFEAQVRDQLRAVATEVQPAPGLAGRVAAARRRQARRRRGQRAATAAVVGLAAAVLGVFVVPSLPGVDVETVGVAAASEATSSTSFRFTTEVDGLGSTVTAEGEVGAGAEEARLTTDLPLGELTGGEVGGQGVEVVLADQTLFVDLGDVGPLPVGEDVEWLAVDLEGGGFADRLAASLVRSVTDVDPSRVLDVLDDVAEEAVEDGREDVAGVPTTRYRFRALVDVDLGLDLGGVEGGGADGTGADGSEVEVRGRAWVDDEGLLRRVQLTEEGVTATTELFDFGRPVDIDPPPPEQVTRIDELVARLGDGG